VLASSINIMQVRITRSRLAGDPADVVISPRLAQMGLLEFHRASVAVEAGKQAVTQSLPQIRQLMEAVGGRD
jgi:NTE family protein